MPVLETGVVILLGAAATELLTFILDVKDKISHCEDQIEQLRMTLVNIIPMIEAANQLDEKLVNRRKLFMDNLIKQLRQGRVLVEKCTEIRCWSWYKKYGYSTEIIKIENELFRFFMLDIQAAMYYDIKQLLADSGKHGRLDELDGPIPGVNPASSLSPIGQVEGSPAPGKVDRNEMEAVANELQKTMLDVMGRSIIFKVPLEQLTTTVMGAIPLINEKLVDVTGPYTDDIIALLKQAKVLVLKCTNVRSWDHYKKYKYSTELSKLNNDLFRFFQLDLQSKGWSDSKKTLADIMQTHRRL